MIRLWNKLSRQDGYALAVGILTVALVAMSGLAVLSRGTSEARLSTLKINNDQASYAAMAGIEHCMGYLVWDDAADAEIEAITTYPATLCNRSGSYEGASYEVRVTTEDGEFFDVISTGRAGGAPRVSSRTITARLRYNRLSSVVGLNYGGEVSLAYGGGSVTIDGGSTVDGELYSYGEIRFTGNTKVCGTIAATYGVYYPNGEPDPLREGCNNRYLTDTIAPPQFDEYLKPAVFPTETVVNTWRELFRNEDGSESYRFSYVTGSGPQNEFKVYCPPTGTREPYCDGPSDLDFANIIYVDGKLALNAMGPIKEQHFTGNVIFLSNEGIVLSAPEVTRLDYIVDGEVKQKTVLQLMTMGGDITFNSNQEIQGHLVNHTGDIKILSTTIRGFAIADNWELNMSNLVKDSYLITKLTKPNVDPGNDDEEDEDAVPDPDEEPQWSIIQFS